MPPYMPLLEWMRQERARQLKLNFGNFVFLFDGQAVLDAFLNSLKIAFISTVLCLLVGYPMAYAIARAQADAGATCC